MTGEYPTTRPVTTTVISWFSLNFMMAEVSPSGAEVETELIAVTARLMSKIFIYFEASYSCGEKTKTPIS